jgi:hypothetical protein
MTDLRSAKALAAARSGALRGDAVAFLGGWFLFGAIIAVLLAIRGLPAP